MAEQPWYWKPAVRKTVRLTRESPCPTCGLQHVETLSHDETDGQGGQAHCPDCGARWRIHDGMPVRKPLDPWIDPTDRKISAYNPWPAVDLVLDLLHG